MEKELTTTSIQNYSDLDVWKKGIELVQCVYSFTNNFPKSEMYGLTSQIQRAAVSIPANIAEGYGRRKTQSFIQFLSISSGSLYELETLLIISEKQDFIKNRDLEKLLNETGIINRMLSSLIHKLQIKVKNNNAL